MPWASAYIECSESLSEHTSGLITANLTFAEWSRVFGHA